MTRSTEDGVNREVKPMTVIGAGHACESWFIDLAGRVAAGEPDSRRFDDSQS